MKRLAEQTLYEILEIPPDAPAEQIQSAYDKARATYGPGSLVTYTLLEPDEAALLEGRIEDARGTLLDPERRARYDESLQLQVEPRVASGSAGPAAFAQPPVIPALQPPAVRDAEPPPAASWPPVGEAALAPPGTEAARPAILLGAALEAAGPAEAPSPPAPGPILLRREVPPPPAQTIAPPPAPKADEPHAAAPAAAAEAPAAAAPDRGAPAFPAPPLPDAWTGEALKQVREGRGLSIPQIAERTKVTRHHIENVEADRFAALPAQVYLRGILLAVARELRLDGQKVARSYLERLSQPGAGAGPAKAR